MRIALLIAVACLLAACGGSDSGNQGSAATQPEAQIPAWVKEALAAKDGPDVAVTMGSADFAIGENRVVFLVVRGNGALVQSPRAEIQYGPPGGPPQKGEAVLEPVGAHEHKRSEEVAPHDHIDATDVYVAHLNVADPGRYWFVVDPAGETIQAVGTMDFAEHSAAPAVGETAPASENPTLADGPAKEITTARPPDTDLLRYSVADSLAAHVPFVVVFATPEFCVSRVCGPTVEVVQKVAHKFAGSKLRFIHVEIYEGNDPDNGYNEWVGEWNLPTEPWVFLVDDKGVIQGRFEGAVAVPELAEAVSEDLDVAPTR